MSTMNVAVGLMGVLTLFVDVWAIIAVARRPPAAFEAAGKSKGLWLVLIIAGIFVCNVSFLVSLWYLFMVDPQVRRMETARRRDRLPHGWRQLPYMRSRPKVGAGSNSQNAMAAPVLHPLHIESGSTAAYPWYSVAPRRVVTVCTSVPREGQENE